MIAGVTYAVLDELLAEVFAVIGTLSMAATPPLLAIDKVLSPAKAISPEPQEFPEYDGHVIIAGFGRVGQFIAWVMRAKRSPFTALDLDPEQISLVKQFGSEAQYGDASWLDILPVADAEKAKAMGLVINDVGASQRRAEIVLANYPDLTIIARARHRTHVDKLRDLGKKFTAKPMMRHWI